MKPIDTETRTDLAGPLHIDRMGDAAARETTVLNYREMKRERPEMGLRDAAALLGTSAASLCRWLRKYQQRGLAGLCDEKHKCGRGSRFPKVTDAETLHLLDLLRKANKSEDACSMMTAAKFFALEDGCRQELRDAILPVIQTGRVPDGLRRIFERLTATHIAAGRRPGMTATENFSGNVGAFVQNKIKRERIVESDDGTVNFGAWIPWPLGGDPCSDKFQVRVGRWQLLPAIEAGWSHKYLGYNLVCRPRGSYRQEDVRGLIYLVLKVFGLPDGFRFERGTWEAGGIVALLRKLGVALDTVHQSNHKPYIEGGFNALWTYLGMIDGQVGRFRGDEEEGNKIMQKCRAGRADPRDHFPSVASGIKALSGAMAMRDSDTIRSIYGSWVPEVRHEQLKQDRPWRPLSPEMEFLFAPYAREWTVAKGTVGGDVPILEDYSAPFYFAHEELWRWNGRKVRLYFDPTAPVCVATILATEPFSGYKPDEVICRADLLGGLPHFCRAARGWADEQCERQVQWRGAALSALRRDLRALGPRGEVMAAISESRDGAGSFARAETGMAAISESRDGAGSFARAETGVGMPGPGIRGRLGEPSLPGPGQEIANRMLLARQAARARAMMEE